VTALSASAVDGVYLALETSGPVGSVAVSIGRDVMARELLPRAQEQSSRIVPAVEATLLQAGISLDRVTGVVVGAGPGSFTGVRIAAATAKGLVHALRVPVWAASSLAAAALADRVLPRDSGRDDTLPDGASEHGQFPRHVLFDARGERLYAACYGVSAEGKLDTIVPPRATTLQDLLSERHEDDAVCVGDGALRHRSRLESGGFRVLGPPAGVPTADALLYMLTRGDAELVANPAGWEPLYLKPSNAERDAHLFDARPSSS
jgi:tRNA threonylcarbamoyladenosine biosynthesis protein TsaB